MDADIGLLVGKGVGTLQKKIWNYTSAYQVAHLQATGKVRRVPMNGFDEWTDAEVQPSLLPKWLRVVLGSLPILGILVAGPFLSRTARWALEQESRTTKDE
ncbi:USP8 [Symbiodinium necroappetens]|uniref:USP8 protein n=1 Tax=Symbiodinium necroappetens TaxID=1628268 RepID=A0A813BML7_9DINO|nr:USP8 [Symbiodinium necroappetens]